MRGTPLHRGAATRFQRQQSSRRGRLRGTVDQPWVGSLLMLALLSALLPVATTAAGAPNTWSATGNLVTARTAHTATLLPNGLVLVAGGADPSGISLASAEVYNPATGTWTATGAMSAPRAYATATLLPTGKVLVAGGATCGLLSCTPLASAELYDPATGTWTATGALHVVRYQHTATLLPNGLVLIAGGCCGMTSSAELYDPGTGTFTPTGSMISPRYAHTATLLNNGKVLVAGGYITSALASAELYDPKTGTWAVTAAMTTARYDHTATVLPNGTVLVAGGLNSGQSELASAELYNPGAGTWSSTGSMVAPRGNFAAVLLPNGTVLAAGGCVNFGAQCLASGGPGMPFSFGTTSAEVYDPAYGSWTQTGSMTAQRGVLTLTVLPNGTALAVGGQPCCPIEHSADVYTPGLGPLVQFAPTGLQFGDQYAGTSGAAQIIAITNTGYAPLAISSIAPVGTNSNDFITTTSCTASPVAPGGGCAIQVRFAPTGTGPRGATMTIVDNAPTSPQQMPLGGYASGPHAWKPTGPMTAIRSGHTATLLPDGNVLVAGGCSTTYADCNYGGGPFLASAELFNPRTGTWSTTGEMANERAFHTATLLPNGKVLGAGGLDAQGNTQSSAELYDPNTGAWTPTGSMASARAYHTATLLPNGRVLVAGGCSDVLCGTPLAGAELYDFRTGVWTPTGAMQAVRAYHTATLLPSGKVLVAGGETAPGAQDLSLATAELYDPQTATWSLTGSMPSPHFSHSATLLLDGTVLVAGGQDCNDEGCWILAKAALYHPTTGTWTATGAMVDQLSSQTATLLPTGQVLVAGGCYGGACDEAELYNPDTGTWAATGAMMAARVYQTATLLPDGRVLAAGGDSRGSAELYIRPRVATLPSSGVAGQRVLVVGSTFFAHEPVRIYWDSTGTAPLTTALATATGNFAAVFTIPAASVGVHAVIAVGQTSGATARTAFTVKP